MNELVQAPSTKIYFDSTFGKNAARILPGEYHVTRDDLVIVTVLGSCVAACISDPGAKIGGMNHFLLPDAGRANEPDSAPARYGTYAMEVLINQLIKLGAQRSRLVAKVFGGASVIAGMTHVNVGQRNADFVLDFLSAEGIPVVASDLEDTCPRKVAFLPHTGMVRVKRLLDAPSEKLVQREQHYRARFAATPIAGDIELFS